MQNWAALVGTLSPTLGQLLLLHLLFPGILETEKLWLVPGLLMFNGGVAGLLLYFERSRP
ncbi:MAG: hypothetical protein SVX43_18920 [Cyanobacteriota bacterium]|nr:hypothetical protein [Cyanobacteriota bacterium]